MGSCQSHRLAASLSEPAALAREWAPAAVPRELADDLVLALAKRLLWREVVDVDALALGPGDEVGVAVGRAVDAELQQLAESLSARDRVPVVSLADAQGPCQIGAGR